MQTTFSALRAIATSVAISAVAAVVSAPVLAPTTPPMDGARVRVFISDLHIGLGHKQMDASGRWTVGPWHPMEDFRWDDEFEKFLAELEARSTRTNEPYDLIIAGDFLELWQTPWTQLDCIYDKEGKALPKEKIDDAAKDLSCSENDALNRIKRVLGAHEHTLDLIRRFSEFGGNTVAIVPGNHDAALAYPSVAKALLDKIGAAPGRVILQKEGYWRSADGQIFAEHGHFIRGDVNSYSKFPASCVDLNGGVVDCEGIAAHFLQRPWGEAFVQRYFNQFEEKYPIIDNVTDELTGVKLALAEADRSTVTKAVFDGFGFLLFGESGSQFVTMFGNNKRGNSRQMLGGTAGATKWDLDQVRQFGDQFLVDSLDPTDPIKPAAQNALKDGRLGLSMADFKDRDADLIRLCDLRAARRQVAITQGRSLDGLTECPGGKELGAIVTSLTHTGSELKSERLETVWKALPQDRPTKSFGVYVYAHTHAAHAGCTPRSVAGIRPSGANEPPQDWNPVIINTGAWQRLITPEQLVALRKANPDRKLDSFLPEHLPACYPVVIVPAYDVAKKEKPTAQLWFWIKNNKGGWQFSTGCPEDENRLKVAGCQN